MNKLLFIIISLLFSKHDFHVTHTTLHYNKVTKSIEITVKASIEDLEKSLNINNSKKLNFDYQQENKVLESLINQYVDNHLKLVINNNVKKYKWVGKELSYNLHDIYLYFEIPNFNKNIESVTIENTLFLDLHSHQTNIVLIELKNKTYNLTFTSDNQIQTFD